MNPANIPQATSSITLFWSTVLIVCDQKGDCADPFKVQCSLSCGTWINWWLIPTPSSGPPDVTAQNKLYANGLNHNLFLVWVPFIPKVQSQCDPTVKLMPCLCTVNEWTQSCSFSNILIIPVCITKYFPIMFNPPLVYLLHVSFLHVLLNFVFSRGPLFFF